MREKCQESKWDKERNESETTINGWQQRKVEEKPLVIKKKEWRREGQSQ